MSQVLTLASSAGPLSTPFSAEEDEDFCGVPDHGPETDHGSSDNFADKLIDMDFPMFDVSTCSKLPSLPCPLLQTGARRKRLVWTNAMLTDDFLLKKSVNKSPAPPNLAFCEDDPFIDILSDSCSITSTESDVSSLDSAGTRSPVLGALKGRPHPQSNQTSPRQTPRDIPYAITCDKTFSNPREKTFANACDKLSPVSYTTSRDKSSEISYSNARGTPSAVSYSYPRERPSSSLTYLTRSRAYPTRERVTRAVEVQESGRCQKGRNMINPREEMNMLRLSCTCQNRNTGKNLHLWEFLLEMLADRRMKSVITWTGQDREFRVVNSREVAREWGNRKNKPHMNFDKMSRAMRYYYKKKILTHGNKQRLVYSFGENPICPHYEKIVELALRTRPVLGGKGNSSQAPGPVDPALDMKSTCWVSPVSPTKHSPASFKSRKESDRMMADRLCPGNRNWTVRRSSSKEHCRNPCCEASVYKKSRTSSNSKLKTGSSSQNKIKISRDLKRCNDQFTFP